MSHDEINQNTHVARKRINYDHSGHEKGGEAGVAAGLAVLRKFFENLPPTDSQMQAYLPDDQPVPDPLPMPWRKNFCSARLRCWRSGR